MKKTIIVTMVAGAFFAYAAAVSAGGVSTGKKPVNKGGTAESRGPLAPEFTLKSLDGKIFRLSDFKGKVVILDFWATWCPPCKAEIPSFIELHNEYSDKGLVVIGAAIDDYSRVAGFVKEYGVNYLVAIADDKLAASYGGINGIPTTFVIDKNGRIARSYTGYRPKAVFAGDFEKLK